MRQLRLPLAAAAALLATPALAHHPLDGAPMATLADGLLSGVGHPLLGIDHLFFVAGVGVAAAFTVRRFLAPLGYVAAMAAGVGLCVAGVGLPLVEPAIALSLLIVGALVTAGRTMPTRALMGLTAALGLFHGWAFGGALAGAEGAAPAAVVVGYLAGLAATQWAVAVAAGLAVTGLLGAARAADLPARLAGAGVAGAGAFLTLEAAEGAALAALGLG
jgi:urease accessory protein